MLSAAQSLINFAENGQHLFSHNLRYRACRMGHGKNTDTNHHSNVEGMRSEQLGGSPSVRHRPPDRQALGGPRAATLGLRPLAGGCGVSPRPPNIPSGRCGGRLPPGCEVGGKRPASVGRSWRSWPRPKDRKSRHRAFIGIYSGWGWSAPAPNGGGPVFRTATSCAPVTAPASAISRWT